MAQNVTIVPYIPAHLAALELGGAHQYISSLRGDPTYSDQLAVDGLSATALMGERVIGCSGVLPQWPGRAKCWALFAEVPRRAWPQITAAVASGLEHAAQRGYRRLEADVDAGFSAAIRWIGRLGFEAEAVMPLWSPTGRTTLRFVRFG